MFVFNRSLFAVLAPLALLGAAVFISNRDEGPPPVAATHALAPETLAKREGAPAARPDCQTVAANLPSR